MLRDRDYQIFAIRTHTSKCSNRVIENVAREAEVKISDRQLLTDAIGKPGTDTDSYLKMMIHNTCVIVDGLGGKCQPF